MRTIFLVRDAERASASKTDALSPAGTKRAECLANVLKDAGIRQVFVNEIKTTQLTAAPIAKQLKLNPTVLPALDSGGLVRKAFYEGTGNSLVVADLESLPTIAAKMKGGKAAITEGEYDKLFEITVMEGAATPLLTLHYCQATSTPTAVPSPTPRKSAPAKKSTTKK
ncbi:MAG TPA: histidine phosphatase family protein [Candidatus Limnocylindrales bacterium]|nr:histidine phosphatase family protein [Candidatus Limnocylindrales bacterium]